MIKEHTTAEDLKAKIEHGFSHFLASSRNQYGSHVTLQVKVDDDYGEGDAIRIEDVVRIFYYPTEDWYVVESLKQYPATRDEPAEEIETTVGEGTFVDAMHYARIILENKFKEWYLGEPDDDDEVERLEDVIAAVRSMLQPR